MEQRAKLQWKEEGKGEGGTVREGGEGTDGEEGGRAGGRESGGREGERREGERRERERRGKRRGAAGSGGGREEKRPLCANNCPTPTATALDTTALDTTALDTTALDTTALPSSGYNFPTARAHTDCPCIHTCPTLSKIVLPSTKRILLTKSF